MLLLRPKNARDLMPRITICTAVTVLDDMQNAVR